MMELEDTVDRILIFESIPFKRMAHASIQASAAARTAKGRHDPKQFQSTPGPSNKTVLFPKRNPKSATLGKAEGYSEC